MLVTTSVLRHHDGPVGVQRGDLLCHPDSGSASVRGLVFNQNSPTPSLEPLVQQFHGQTPSSQRREKTEDFGGTTIVMRPRADGRAGPSLGHCSY
ncbi:hypothetical protein AOLI_G00153480 [Acnodon oligacanthus]